MTFDDIRNARSAAQQAIGLADAAVRQACALSVGRLRVAEVYKEDLRKLKKELQMFNARTGDWKDQP